MSKYSGGLRTHTLYLKESLVLETGTAGTSWSRPLQPFSTRGHSLARPFGFLSAAGCVCDLVERHCLFQSTTKKSLATLPE
jgi:hypothetical protein